MKIDLKEAMLQLKALVRLCILHPNSWREVLIGLIAMVFAPVVIVICILANIHYEADGNANGNTKNLAKAGCSTTKEANSYGERSTATKVGE